MDDLVVLLTTGGTVATMVDPATGRSAPSLDPERLAELAAVPGIRLESRGWSTVPSWSLDPSSMADLAMTARDLAADPTTTGIVVTHGTTTLEYSAFLTGLVAGGGTPIVLTGAMRRADDPEPDGPRNVRDAVRVAASPRVAGFGSLVVFAGRIISGVRAWKAQRTDVDAFVDLGGDVGRIVDGEVEIARRPPRTTPFSGRLLPNVGFVKVVPGADGRLIDAVLAAAPAGLVIEGLPGAGGIPPAMQSVVKDAAAALPVVLATRSPFGRPADSPSGGTGEPLRGAGLLSAGVLTAEQSWLLLMLALGDSADRRAETDRFQLAVAEISGVPAEGG